MTNLNSNEVSHVKEQNKFLARTYGWMTLALIISGIVAFGTYLYAVSDPQAFRAIFGAGFYILALGEIILVWWLSASIRKISVGAASFAFLLYSVLNGITLSSIFIVYQHASLFSVFFISAVMFFMMAIYGSFTKSNLLSFGRYFSMALIGIIIASIVNILLHSQTLDWMLSIAIVVLFTGLTAYDAQKMLRASEYAQDTDVFKKASIIGALELYLDFINIFLAMLRLFGKRK